MCYRSRLLRHGRCFVEDNFASAGDEERISQRPPLTLWDRTTIWKNLPEISYTEVMESDRGLMLWLEMFHRFGIALLRGVPNTRVQSSFDQDKYQIWNFNNYHP